MQCQAKTVNTEHFYEYNCNDLPSGQEKNKEKGRYALNTLELIGTKSHKGMDNLEEMGYEFDVKEIDLLGDTSEARNFGGAAELGRGRHPFACADICGEGDSGSIHGKASFYYTPLGMLICATVGGLGRNRGIYSLSVTEDDGVWRKAPMQCAIPPLYERGGRAWCSALTGKISPCELIGKRITLWETKHGGKVATGKIRCARG
jgi:hypothetical protein